ncbi:MAG: hypothetical protein ACP5NL_02875 [Thermoplasmata archaeon]
MRGKILAVVITVMLICIMHINTVNAENTATAKIDGIYITGSTAINLSFYYSQQISISDLFYLLTPANSSRLSSFLSFLEYKYQNVNGEAYIVAYNNTAFRNYSFDFSLNSQTPEYNTRINLTNVIGEGYIANKMYICANYTDFGWDLIKFRFTFDQQPIFDTIIFNNLDYNYTIPLSINDEPLLYMGTDSFLPSFNPFSLEYLDFPNFNFFPDMLSEINNWNFENGSEILCDPPIGSVGIPDHWINAVFTNTITAYNYTYILPNFSAKILAYPAASSYKISIYKGNLMPEFYINRLSLFKTINMPDYKSILNISQTNPIFQISLNHSITDFTIFVSAGNLTDAYYFQIYKAPKLKVMDLMGINSTIFISENSTLKDTGFGSDNINNSQNINISGNQDHINIYGFKNPICAPNYTYPYFDDPIGPIFVNNSLIFALDILYLYDFYEPYKMGEYMLVQSNQILENFRNMFDFYYYNGSENTIELKTNASGEVKIYDLFGNLINGSSYYIDLNKQVIKISELDHLEAQYEFLNVKKIVPLIKVFKEGDILNITAQNISNLQDISINRTLKIEYSVNNNLYVCRLNMSKGPGYYYASFRLQKQVGELVVNYNSSNIFTQNVTVTFIFKTNQTPGSFSFLYFLFIILLLVLAVIVIEGGRDKWI